MTPDSPKFTRREVIPILLGSGLMATGIACSRTPDSSRPVSVPPPNRFPPTIPEQEFQRLNLERKKLIAIPVQKPADAIPFPYTPNEVTKVAGTNIQLSLNGYPNGLEIFYSPYGLKKLYEDLNLSTVPAFQFHLYTGAPNEGVADTQWQEGNCKFHNPIQYMETLVEYVLKKYPRNDWDRKQLEITQEWNNRISAIARNGSKRATSFQIKDCKLVSQTPTMQAEIEAMQAEIQGKNRPLLFWLNLKSGELLSKHPLVQTFWYER